MEIEMLPELRRKELYGGIECRCAGDNDAEQGGIHGVDVVEMDNVCLLLKYFPQEVAGTEQAYDDQKDDEVRVGEGRDEL